MVADAVDRDGSGVVASWGDLGAALRAARVGFDDLRARCLQVFQERYTESAFVSRRTELYQEVAA